MPDAKPPAADALARHGVDFGLPKGEVPLWTGRPNAWALALDAFALRWVGIYAAVLAIWGAGVVSDQVPLWAAAVSATPFLLVGAASGAILWLLAWVQARSTRYAITPERVAMRFGVATPVAVNLPLHEIAEAAVDLRKGGVGTIALTLGGRTRIPYIALWPHLRPWRANPTQPALRCIPDAADAAAVLKRAIEAKAEPARDYSSRIAAE